MKHLSKIEKLNMEEYVIELRTQDRLTIEEIQKNIQDEKGLKISRESIRRFLNQQHIQ